MLYDLSSVVCKKNYLLKHVIHLCLNTLFLRCIKFFSSISLWKFHQYCLGNLGNSTKTGAETNDEQNNRIQFRYIFDFCIILVTIQINLVIYNFISLPYPSDPSYTFLHHMHVVSIIEIFILMKLGNCKSKMEQN